MKKTSGFNIVSCFLYLFAFAIISFISASLCNAETGKFTQTEAFKWYEFGKINISISSTNSNLTAGAVLPLNFKATNNNKFPITEGSLYVKIYREKNYDSKKDYFKESASKEELNDKLNLVDQFFAAENLSMDANGTVDFKYDYEIPQSAQGGKYRVVAYFQSIKKFNLQGLSFTDDTPGSVFYYEVINPEQSGTVEFERNNILVNGEQYDFNSILKIYGADENVNISASLYNSTNASQKVDISKIYYSWDGLDEKNIFGNDNNNLVLAAGEKKNIEFTVPKTTKPVTYMTMRAEWGNDSRSIINIRFAREVPADARINSAGITKFPIKANDSANIFITAHEVKSFLDFEIMEKMANDEVETVQNNSAYRLDTLIKDNKQKILQSFSYEGELSADVSGFDTPISFKEDHYYLVIESTLTNLRTNSVVDKTIVTYHCQNKNYSGCPAGVNYSEEEGQVALSGKRETESQENVAKRGSLTSKIIVIVVLVVLLLLIAAGHNKIKKALVILFFLSTSILVGSLLFAPDASAESVTHSATVPRIVYKCPLYVKTNYNYFWHDAHTFGWSATYSAKATSDSAGNNPLPSGSTLTPGQEFYLTNTTDSSTAVSYYMTGSYCDTPYAYFNANAARDASKWDLIYSDGYNENMSSSFSFNPLSATAGAATNNYSWNNCTQTSVGSQTSTTDANAPITCAPYAANVWKCTVSSFTTQTSGSVKTVYGCTYGALYYKAWRQGQTNSTAGTCTDRFVVCNYYQGLFQQMLEGGSTPEYGLTEGVCGTIGSSGYAYPPLEGCRINPNCANTGPSVCSAGTNHDYRPNIPQQEITFNYNISQPDFQISSFTATPSSGEAPLNGVQLKVILGSVGASAFPSGTATFNYDCNNGNTYTYSAAAANGTTYTLPQACSYNPSADTTYNPSVQVTIGSLVKSASTPVSVTIPSVSVSCGLSANQRFCLLSELNSDLCLNGSVHDAPSESGNVFNWTCGDGSISCSAEKYCESDPIWEEMYDDGT